MTPCSPVRGGALFHACPRFLLLSSCWLLPPQGVVFLLARPKSRNWFYRFASSKILIKLPPGQQKHGDVFLPCTPAANHQHLLTLLLLSFVSLCRRLLGIITKKDILRHMAQMANQDPESIMFNWSAPSRTAGGEGETTARRRRCTSWTAPISDIRTLFFVFFLVLSFVDGETSPTACGSQRL